MLIKKAFIFLTLLAVSCIGVTEGAEYSAIRIDNVNIKNQGETASVSPGETFGVHASYKFLQPRECGSIVQIIVGFKGLGAKTCIANGIVLENGRFYDYLPLAFRNQYIDITEKDVDFALIAPQEAGIYEIRFRYAQAYLPHEAVSSWWNVDEAPAAAATIGTIIVE
jgi:hypothetical protein